MPWIKELSYRTLSEGSLNGILAYEIEFSGEEPASSAEIADVVLAIQSKSGGRRGNVHLTGKFPVETLTLAKSLSDMGFTIFATIDGSKYYHWLILSKFTQVKLKSPVWAPFICEEIIVTLTDINQPEPHIASGSNPILFLESSLTGNETLAYVKKGKLTWNINRKTTVLKELMSLTPQS